jgi:hypothetical protein
MTLMVYSGLIYGIYFDRYGTLHFFLIDFILFLVPFTSFAGKNLIITPANFHMLLFCLSSHEI